jgi:hypothetical protein
MAEEACPPSVQGNHTFHCGSVVFFNGGIMREIRNSLGTTYNIGMTLSDVRRLQQGVQIDAVEVNGVRTPHVLLEDFGHSDGEKLNEQVNRLLELPLFAVDLMYALLPSSVREQVSFAQFIGEGSNAEPWKTADLWLATLALTEEVLDFFRGRIPAEAVCRKRIIQIANRQSQEAILNIERLSDDQFQLAMVAANLGLNPEAYRPIILKLNEPATMTVEEAAKAIESLYQRQNDGDATSGGTKSNDLPESLASPTTTDSPIVNSDYVPAVASSETPLVPLPSAPLQAS